MTITSRRGRFQFDLRKLFATLTALYAVTAIGDHARVARSEPVANSSGAGWQADPNVLDELV
jgi:hypothetical protein